MVGSFTAVPTLACGRMLISRSTSEAAVRQVVKSWKLSLSSWRMPAVRNSRSAKPPRHSPVYDMRPRSRSRPSAKVPSGVKRSSSFSTRPESECLAHSPGVSKR